MRPNFSEKLFVEEVTQASKGLNTVSRGLSIGTLIKMIRLQLGMSQVVLAKRAGVPQSTISRVEQENADIKLSTISKILQAMFCHIAISPLLQDSIDNIRKAQAKKIAKNNVGYLAGTMSLELQNPDNAFIEGLIKQEEERLLHGPDLQLWGE